MSISSKVLEYTAQIQQLLDKINAEVAVGDFKTPTMETPKPEQTEQERMKSILSVAPGLSEIQLRKLIDEEKAKAAGLLTFEACLHLVASNLGLEFEDGKFKTRQEEKFDKKTLPPVEAAPPTLTDLQNAGIDPNLINYMNLGMLIKNRRYIEPVLFNKIDQVLTAMGYRYEKGVGWHFQGEAKSQPQKAAPAKDKATKVIRISDLNQDLKSPTIEGQLLDDPIQRDVDTKHGPATVTSFRVDDGSGICRVSLWGELAESAMNLTSGVKVRITSLMVREPYDGMPQVSGGKWSKVTQL